MTVNELNLNNLERDSNFLGKEISLMEKRLGDFPEGTKEHDNRKLYCHALDYARYIIVDVLNIEEGERN